MIDFIARAATWARLAKALLFFDGRHRDRLARLCLDTLMSGRLDREFIAHLYVRGRGIEIGALHRPLPLPPDARATYVDRLPVEELRRQYPELGAERLVPVGIVDDGERLATVPDASQDFVIANSFIEHCEDPLTALRNMFRVLRTGGILYLSAPDKRLTFDRDRPVTDLEHILRDHREGPGASRRQHYLEWARLVEHIRDDAAAARRADHLMETRYSIHFHVWTPVEIFEWLAALKRHVGLAFTVELAWYQAEQVLVLRKMD
jgi:SAM-dependent methyltransferase